MDEQQTERLLALLGSIAGSLATIERSLLPEAPNYKRPIEDFATFDWDSIGARVVKTDVYGVAQVEHNDQIYTRRAPENKFNEAIWFSRPDGKDADGNNRYVRLITFRKFGEAEPISRKAEALVQRAAPAAQDARQTATEAPGAAQPAQPAQVSIPAKTTATAATDEFDALSSASAARQQAGEQVRAKLRAMATGYNGQGSQPASNDQRQRAFNNLRTLCGNDEAKRHAVIQFLFGKASLTELTAGEAQAIRDWVHVSKQGEEWLPSPTAIADLKTLLQAANLGI